MKRTSSRSSSAQSRRRDATTKKQSILYSIVRKAAHSIILANDVCCEKHSKIVHVVG